MNMKNTLLAAALVGASGIAFATPEYDGLTSGAFVDALDASSTDAQIDAELTEGAGYYIWNSSPKDWHVRWTAQSSTNYDFFGSITLSSNGISGVSEFQFESSAADGGVDWNIIGTFDDSATSGVPATNVVSFESGNNCCWDGFDLVLLEALSIGDEMTFELYSDIWGFEGSGLNGVPGQGSNGDVEGTGIFISSEFFTPDVEILGSAIGYTDNTGTYGQRFEISVPESQTLALFGLGLAGLAMARRKRA